MSERETSHISSIHSNIRKDSEGKEDDEGEGVIGKVGNIKTGKDRLLSPRHHHLGEGVGGGRSGVGDGRGEFSEGTSGLKYKLQKE